VDLPVRLAVALLKDTKGTISIELPVQGNLNDPQFSVMPIIWQTLRNLVLRAAQAPFKFIAGLVGGDQVDLSQVRFAPASSELDGEARQALDTLVSALQQRPALQLEVEGMSASAADSPLLAERRLQQEYRETWYRILQRRGDKVPADASQIQIDEDDEAPLLEGIYRSRLKQQPPAEWRELEPEERTQRLRQAVVDSWAGNTALLRRLSQQRAAAIKDHLVQAGLDAERIYLLDTGTAEAEPDGKVATMLHLGS
jgi:outer membrane protein OmpA-like peptidoglycan-associated protein